jgi:hypothetical protein
MLARRFRVSALALLLLAPLSALATDVSPDITISLGGVTTADQDVAEDTGGSFALIDVGPLPGNVDVVGYEVVGAGVQLALDTTVALAPGGIIAEPRDVVLWNGASYSIAFDGSAEGVPAGARIDAIGAGTASELLLSFDTTLDLPGASGVPDEAVVSFDGATFTVIFDGTALGAHAAALDTDGLATVSSDTLRLSFDTSGSVGGVSFDDEDALDYESTGGTWTLAYDGSASDPAWGAADLVALPEPGFAAALGAGAALVAGLRRGRSALRREHALR